MDAVSIARCPDYSSVEVQRAVAEALAPLGGMAAFVSAGQRVFIKPNLLSKAEPERAVTTHPEVLRAVIREVKACGAASVAVGDSPGGRNSPGSIRSVVDGCGLTAVCTEEGAELVLLDDDVVRVPNPSGSALYAFFNLGHAVVDTDVLIDLAKFKTHGFMMFTGAVKNCFGCIPGLEKAQFHLKVPDRDDFGEMLVDLMLACAPKLAIMDAVIGMEGEGPAGGTPKQIGAVIASADCVALDVVASAMAGFDPMEVYTNKAAAGRGLGPSSVDEVQVLGTPWRELAPEHFEKPTRDLSRGMPPWLGRFARRVITSKPYLERPAECTSCATCKANCPVGAITMVEKRPSFDYDACIRCYFCQELCPPQVIGLKTPWLVRTLVASGRGSKA